MRKIEIKTPDDWHLHVRDHAQMKAVINDTARQFARAIIMPNLLPPVTSCAQAIAYRDRILSALQPGLSFNPLMTLYLTDNIGVAEISSAAKSPFIHAAKLYPAGATTNSDAGVSSIEKIFPYILIVIDICAAIVYYSQGDWRRGTYWIAACVLTGCVTI